MQRVYAVVKEEIVHLIDDRAKVGGIIQSQWLSKAIDAVLHPPGDDEGTLGDDTFSGRWAGFFRPNMP